MTRWPLPRMTSWGEIGEAVVDRVVRLPIEDDAIKKGMRDNLHLTTIEEEEDKREGPSIYYVRANEEGVVEKRTK